MRILTTLLVLCVLGCMDVPTEGPVPVISTEKDTAFSCDPRDGATLTAEHDVVDRIDGIQIDVECSVVGVLPGIMVWVADGSHSKGVPYDGSGRVVIENFDLDDGRDHTLRVYAELNDGTLSGETSWHVTVSE